MRLAATMKPNQIPYFHCQCCNNLLTDYEVEKALKYCSQCLGDGEPIEYSVDVDGEDYEED